MLDHSEEKRQQAQIRIAAFQQQIQATHHKKVKPKEVQIGDLVLRCVIQSTRLKDQGMLGPNWKGPYIIIARGGNGSYTLTDPDGSQLNK